MPAEVVQVGQEIRVKVLKHDVEKGPRFPRPEATYPGPLGDGAAAPIMRVNTLAGRVVSLADYGAFVELEPGVEGLIHISEMSWSKRLRHPSKILKSDDPR